MASLKLDKGDLTVTNVLLCIHTSEPGLKNASNDVNSLPLIRGGGNALLYMNRTVCVGQLSQFLRSYLFSIAGALLVISV